MKIIMGNIVLYDYISIYILVYVFGYSVCLGVIYLV